LEKFDFKYKKAWKFNHGHKTLVTEMEGGKEQRRSKGIKKRSVILEFDKTTNYNNDAQEIIDFFNRHKGKAISFLFDLENPDGSVEEVTMRFNQDVIDVEAFKNKAHSFTLELIEVL